MLANLGMGWGEVSSGPPLPSWLAGGQYGSYIFKTNKILLVSPSGTQWVDYIPVKQLYPPTEEDVNRWTNQGAVAVEIISSGIGLAAWKDYIPAVEVGYQNSGRWKTDNIGFLPIVDIT